MGKKVKSKALSYMLTGAMALSMSGAMAAPAMAAAHVPAATDSATGTVTGIREDDAIVYAYQIVHADYDRNAGGSAGSRGFIGYEMSGGLTTNTGKTVYGETTDTDAPATGSTADIANFYTPTKAEIGALASKIVGGEYASKVTDTYSYDNSDTKIARFQLTTDGTKDANGNYTYSVANLPVGEYIVLVKGTNKNIYNPMVLSISYDRNQSGTSNDQAQNGSLTGRGSKSSTADNNIDVDDKSDHFLESTLNPSTGVITYAAAADGIVQAKWSTTGIKKTITTTTANNSPKDEFGTTYNPSTAAETTHGDDARIGDQIAFQIVADIPAYDTNGSSSNYQGVYNSLQFKISDTMQEGCFEKLGFDNGAANTQNKSVAEWNNIKVYSRDLAGHETEISAEDAGYVLTAESGSYTLSVDFGTENGRKFILDHPGEQIVVRYTSELAAGANTGFNPNDNSTMLEYTHNPQVNNEVEYITDEARLYTFKVTMTKIAMDTAGNIESGVTSDTASATQSDIGFSPANGDKTNDNVTTAEGSEVFSANAYKTADGNRALAGAEFTIYQDAACTQPLDATPGDTSDNAIVNNANGVSQTGTNKITTAVATSDERGQFTFNGLDEGTYYIKETKAPNGYALNDHIYKVDITTTYASVDDTLMTSIAPDQTATQAAYNGDTKTSVVNKNFVYGEAAKLDKGATGQAGSIKYAGVTYDGKGIIDDAAVTGKTFSGPRVTEGKVAEWTSVQTHSQEELLSYTVKVTDISDNDKVVSEVTYENKSTISDNAKTQAFTSTNGSDGVGIQSTNADAINGPVGNGTVNADGSAVVSTADIVDVKMSNLPSTGGKGTLFLALAGAVAIIGAVSLSRKKKEVPTA